MIESRNHPSGLTRLAMDGGFLRSLAESARPGDHVAIRTVDARNGASWHHCVCVGPDRVAPMARHPAAVAAAAAVPTQDFLIDALLRSASSEPPPAEGDRDKKSGSTYSDVAVIVNYDDDEHERTLDELLAEVPVTHHATPVG